MGWIELTADEISKRAHGKWGAYISGIVHYWDQIDTAVEHTTRFCYAIRTDSLINDPERPTYDLCEYWNCIDDECKEDKRQYRAAVARAFKAAGKAVPPDFYGRAPPE